MTLPLFDNIFKITFWLLILVEMVSLLSYLLPFLHNAAFFIVLLLVLAISLYKLEYGLYIMLAELMVGGKGQIFSLETSGLLVSVRIAIFLIIMAVWLATKIKNKQLLNWSWYYPYYLLLAAVSLGLINGLANNELSNVFFDFNAWIFFATVPIFFEITKNNKIMENILQVLTGATFYLSLKTIGILYLFSHNITGVGGQFYKWIRDSGVGEVTYISGTVFRVFMQSQIYILIGLAIVLILLASQKITKDKIFHYLSYLYLGSLALMISQSRSFWVGGAAAILFALVFMHLMLQVSWKKTLAIGLSIVLIITSQIFIIQFITNNYSGNLVAQRFNNLKGEAAGASRLNQLNPLTYNILQQAIFGYGFGKELTYISSDPRIVKTHPGGVYSTYAFEWGYLDTWLKLGLFGFTAYAVVIISLFSQALKKATPLSLGLLVGLIALLFTNIFSPYLNHPLGISYIILMSAWLKDV